MHKGKYVFAQLLASYRQVKPGGSIYEAIKNAEIRWKLRRKEVIHSQSWEGCSRSWE